MAPQLTSTTILGIDVLIDRLLADPARSVLVAHPAGNLLRGPPRSETTLDLVTQPGIAHQLALSVARLVVVQQPVRGSGRGAGIPGVVGSAKATAGLMLADLER